MKILSLDGGGVFGKAQSKVLADAACWDKWDCFVGTSIGSAQMAAAALGMQEKVVPAFFDEWMPKVFHRNWLRRLNPFVSRYPDDGLNEALQGLFDTALLGDVKKPLFVAAADVSRRTLKVYNSKDSDDARLPMWEVIRGATAAETYFDSWKGMSDGGVFANNPSMVAVAAALKVLGAPMQEIEVFSMGTGRSTKSGGSIPRGMIQWGFWIVPAMLEGAADDMHDYFVRSMPIKNYVRVQFLRDAAWKMDSVENMDEAMSKWDVDMLLAAAKARSF